MINVSKTTIDYVYQIQRLFEDFDQMVQNLANKYTDEVIQPLCEKYNLKFWSRNRSFYVENLSNGQIIVEDNVISALTDWDKDMDGERNLNYKMYCELENVFDILNEEISDGKLFGYWCGLNAHSES